MTREAQKALEAAWKSEKRGENEYQKRATAIGNPLGKVTFHTLALRQKKYLETIRKVHAALQTGNGGLIPKIRFPTFSPVSALVKQILTKTRQPRPDDVESNHGTLFRTYLWALRFEERSWAAYTREAKRSHGELVEKLLHFLQRQKGEHYRILDETLACCHASNPVATESDRHAPFQKEKSL
ncbi:MAG: hypothetical protein V1784_01945 [bacterium]